MLALNQRTKNQHLCVYIQLFTVLVSACLIYHVPVQSAVGKCPNGDASCFCTAVGGQWIATPTTIRPTCRKTIRYQGLQRIIDVYFPAGVKASGVRYTPWIYLHGVHTAEWYIQSNPSWRQLHSHWPVPLAGNAQADQLEVLTGTAITTGNSSSNQQGGGLVKDGRYILVVPEATGTPEEGQIWNSIYWSCMDAVPKKCVNTTIDDIGFIAQVLKSLPTLLPGIQLNNKSILSGYSNGGMLVQALLCEQPSVANNLASISILASTLGADFAAKSCKANMPRSLPVMWVHGTADDTLPYHQGMTEGVAVLGVEAAVKHWATRMGCASAAVTNPSNIYTDTSRGVTCRNYCNQALQQQQQQQQQRNAEPVVLCTAVNQPHQLLRTMPGYPASLVRWAAPAAGSRSAFNGSPELF